MLVAIVNLSKPMHEAYMNNIPNYNSLLKDVHEDLTGRLFNRSPIQNDLSILDTKVRELKVNIRKAVVGQPEIISTLSEIITSLEELKSKTTRSSEQNKLTRIIEKIKTQAFMDDQKNPEDATQQLPTKRQSFYVGRGAQGDLEMAQTLQGLEKPKNSSKAKKTPTKQDTMNLSQGASKSSKSSKSELPISKPKQREKKDSIVDLRLSREGKKTLRMHTKFRSGKEKTLHRKMTLGEGAFGKVVAFRSPSLDTVVAAKELKKEEEKSESTKLVMEQFKNPLTGEKLEKIPGIIEKRLFVHIEKEAEGAEGTTNRTVVTLDPAYQGDLTQLKQRGQTLNFADCSQGISQLLFGLAHLHNESAQKEGLVHGDIKLANILYRKEEGKTEFCFTDFDGAQPAVGIKYGVRTEKMMDYDDAYMLSHLLDEIPVDHPDFRAAEAKPVDFNKSLDIRALGVALRSLLTGVTEDDLLNIKYDEYGGSTLKKEELKPEDLQESITKGVTSQQKQCLEGICALINRMTSTTWTERPTAEEALLKLAQLNIQIPSYE